MSAIREMGMTNDFDIEEYLRETYPKMHYHTRNALIRLWHHPTRVSLGYSRARLFQGRVHAFRGQVGTKRSESGGHFYKVYYFDDGTVNNRWSAINKWIEINLNSLKKSDFAPQLFMQFFSRYELDYIKRRVKSGR